MAAPLGEQPEDAPGQPNGVLGGLRPLSGVLDQDVEREDGLVRLLAGPDLERHGRAVNGEIPGSAHPCLSYRGRVAHRHRQGAEDPDVLTLGQTESEVGAVEVRRGVLEERDQVVETDEGLQLIQGRRLDAGFAQQPGGIAAEIDHQLAVAPKRWSAHETRQLGVLPPSVVR